MDTYQPTRKKKMREFKEWFEENLYEYAKDIASYGADMGFPYISYTSDCVKLWEKYGVSIWKYAVEQAKQLGYTNVAKMISSFSRADMLESLDSFYNLMVWYACEEIAREITDQQDEDEYEDEDEDSLD
jgi:hypothetical protein